MKRIVKTNHNIIPEQCVRNDDDVLAVSDEDKKIAWKNYHEKLFKHKSFHGIKIVCLRQKQLAAYLA